MLARHRFNLAVGYTKPVTLTRNLIIVSAVGLLLATSFGASYFPMHVGTDGKMSGCPLMGVPALCHMNPLEHAFTLQNMLTAVPFSGIFALLVSILLALAITLVAPLCKSLGILSEPILRPPTRRDRFVSRHSLQEAFSGGILNTKAF